MGTGVGEAMLIGAVTGAGTSAVTGGDPLKGALLGAVGGGAGAGLAGAGAGATSGTAAGTTSGTAVGTTAGAAPIVPASAAIPGASPGVLPTTTGTLTTAQAGLPEAAGQFGTSVMPSGASYTSTMMPGVDKDISLLAGQPIAAPAQSGGSGLSIPTPSSDDTRQASKYFPNISDLYAENPNLFPAVAGASTSAIFGGPEKEKEKDGTYRGPLSDFRYSRTGYTPYRVASGGLMDTAAARRMTSGGHLGSYSDGGQLLKGREADSNGMNDDIPASIEGSQPALLADGEFVVPADVVSGLGNGSTEAGARELYAMMDKVRKARTGSTEQAPEIDADRMMPA